jgi:hypothetical protein
VNYAHSYVRPMMAEVVLDVLNSALGIKERWGQDVKRGAQAVEVGTNFLTHQPEDNPLDFLRRFGRPLRTSACDCQRVTAPSLAQQLFLMTNPGLLDKLNDPTGRLPRLLSGDMSDDEVLDELFLATLSRWPAADERQAFREHRRKVPDRQAAFANTMWALLNTREFFLNH